MRLLLLTSKLLPKQGFLRIKKLPEVISINENLETKTTSAIIKETKLG
jgi:hypothetical protein